MRLDSFRAHLKERQEALESIYEELKGPIRDGRFTDEAALWSNKDLVHCSSGDIRSAHVIFPSKVHLLPVSVFYDRVYVDLHDRNFTTMERIDSEHAFRLEYQMSPVDFCELVRVGRVVPILPLDPNDCSDYVVEHVIAPILVEELPYLTFQGHALICNIWQIKYQALPDPQIQKTWGFLMDLCEAMGIGANLVRPEFPNDIWSGREVIFDALGFDEVAKHFTRADLSLDEFFVTTGIAYSARVPIRDYLSLFDKVDRQKIYSLYSNRGREGLFQELADLNRRLKEASKEVEREEIYLKVLSAPIGLLFYVATQGLSEVLGKGVVEGLKSMSEEHLRSLLRGCKNAFQDNVLRSLDDNKRWLNAGTFPEVLELARVRHAFTRLKKDS